MPLTESGESAGRLRIPVLGEAVVDTELSIRKALTHQQFIYAGIASGILLFAVVAVVIGNRVSVQAEVLRFLVPGLAVLTLIAGVAAVVLRGIIIDRARQRVLELPDDVDPIPTAAVYWQRSSLTTALAADLVGTLACAVYLVTKAPAALALAGLAIALLFARFPSRARLNSFLIEAGVR
ncbi:MAG TPA: hypothetical protein P5159_04780 [Phycisphaerae bacterium]|nr:hypothetical protein [Phycisphaerae bacterium]